MSTQQNQHIKNFLLTTCVLFILAIFMAGPVTGKSVYVAANHHDAQFDAWNIGSDGTISKQATYTLQHATDPAGIAVDAVHSSGNPDSSVIFITSEFSGGVEIVNPVTLEYIGVSSGPSNLAGIDVDDVDNIVYTLGRHSHTLYIYEWDPVAKTLIQQAMVYLPGMSVGYGIAFDDIRDILWVTDTYNNMVRAYDVNVTDWADIVEISALSFSVSHHPVDVVVDRARNFVYTVGGWFGSNLLTKYDVSTGIETTIDCGNDCIGLAVEEIKGYVYLTRWSDMQVWDCSTNPFTLIQNTGSIGNPAGLVISNISYNPLNLAKNDDVQGYGVYIGQTFPYQITFDNFDNTFEVTGVMVRDDLPVELDFVSETMNGTPGTGVYESGTHTVTWDVGTIPAGQEGPAIELVVKINENAIPNTTIYNNANIWCNEIDTTTEPGYDPDNPDPEETPGTFILPIIPVALDIKPCSCPNPLNVKSQGHGTFIDKVVPEDMAVGLPVDKLLYKGPVIPVAILGTTDFDVTEIDVTTVTLEDVPMHRWNFEDVGTPMADDAVECECNTDGPDGFVDMTLKFYRTAIIAALGEVYDGDIIPLTITGELMDGTPFEGADCMVILGDSAPLAVAGNEPNLINYPNPFNPVTEISFALPQVSNVKLEIFNIMGQKVTTLVDEQLSAGEHTCIWDGTAVASGVYFYRLTTQDFIQTKKMMLLK